MGDGLDVPLEDPVQRDEVEMLSSLMIVAGRADRPLGQHEIDDLLGLSNGHGPASGAPGESRSGDGSD